MSIQPEKIAARQLLNSQVGREITGSISNMIHRGIDKTSGTLQRGIDNVSQNIKDRTSVDNMTNSINKTGGKKRTRKYSGGFNIIENEDGNRMNVIENDEPHVNVIEDDHMNDMNVIENDEPHVNVIEDDHENEMNVIENDEPHVNVIEDDHMIDMNVIENEVTGGKRKKNNSKTKKTKKSNKKTKKTK